MGVDSYHGPWVSIFAELGVPGRSKSAAVLAVTLTRAVCCGSKAKPAEPAWNLESSSTPNSAEIHTHASNLYYTECYQSWVPIFFEFLLQLFY